MPCPSWFNGHPAGITGLPWRLSGKESASSAGDAGLIPGQEDPLEKEMATHSSTLAWNPMDRRAWWATVHGVTKSWTWLNDWTTSRGNTGKPELWWGLALMEQSNHHIPKISSCFPFPIKKISNSYTGTVSKVKQKLLSGNSPPLCPFSENTFLQFSKVAYHHILFYFCTVILH